MQEIGKKDQKNVFEFLSPEKTQQVQRQLSSENTGKFLCAFLCVSACPHMIVCVFFRCLNLEREVR